MALLIATNGTVGEVKPENGTSFSLEELQGFVGGYIQILNRLKRADFNGGVFFKVRPDTHIMVINEEGKNDDLPFNSIATNIYEYGDDDPIVGDVVICTQEEAGD